MSLRSLIVLYKELLETPPPEREEDDYHMVTGAYNPPPNDNILWIPHSQLTLQPSQTTQSTSWRKVIEKMAANKTPHSSDTVETCVSKRILLRWQKLKN